MRTRKTNKLNPIQIHLLKMFNYVHTKKNLEEMKEVLAKHFAQKVDDDLDELWEKKKLSQTKLKKMANQHKRTPYRK